MKRIFCIVYIAFSLTFLSCSGDIFDNIKEHASEEKVYVGKFDKAEALVGINRLEIDLMDAGRIPADKLNIGKAVQTIVEYDGKSYPCEGVLSWLNITGLTEPRLYRITVYNVDEFGNKSLPVEVAAIPFTDDDIAALVVPMPQKLLAPASVQFNWNNGLTSSFLDFYEMDYSYTDAQGKLQTGKSTDNKSLLILNLAAGSAGKVNLRLKVVPKQNNIAILDTAYIESSIDYQLPTIEQYLNARDNRKIKNTYREGTDATVTWIGDIPDHLVISELMYETTSGTFNTLIIDNSTTEIECPDAQPEALYKTRFGYVPPGAVDTLYKDWKTSKYPFLTIPLGTYKVDPLSYRYYEATGELTADIPQSEYAGGTKVTLEAVEEAAYRVSDLFGGFYEYGRGYGSAYRCWGDFSLDDVLLAALPDPWPYGWNTVDVIGWDLASKTFTIDVYWDGSYVFRLKLVKE
ncbi:MAG: DUF5012 domain-containing protein [Prevotellaceae bacterium]|jgi:hypothetical protein|nr:DUF5012 domain-containing protein [Prevotellaceae bacterium]